MVGDLPRKGDPSRLGPIQEQKHTRVEPVRMNLGSWAPEPHDAGRPSPDIHAEVEPPVVTAAPRGPLKGDGFPFHVIILSANAENCARCVSSILMGEKDIPAGWIVVVDDGAKAGCASLLGVEWIPGVKPFAFARNANIGIQWAGTDVILMNDDAELETPGGLTALCRAARERPEIGVMSAAIRGSIGNESQVWRGDGTTRREARRLSFVCVYIKLEAFAAAGLLDERFVGYGYEDDDFCLRVLKAGMELGVHDPCMVDHSSPGASSYRTRDDFARLAMDSRLVFEKKWGVGARRTGSP